MVKLPARLLAVFALAGAVLGIVGLTKIGSTPAQDVAPPAGSSPPSAGEIPDGVPGVSSDSSSGAGGSAGPSGPDQTVSSVVNPTEPAFEWTMERMLLATPMPMTQEERDFLSKHPPLEKIREWTQEQFDVYVNSELGRRQAAQEGVRWRELVAMLKKQHKAGVQVLGKKRKPLPVSGNLNPQQAGKDTIAGVTEWDASQFDTMDSDQLQKVIREHPVAVFAVMKQWRSDIAVLASSVESMRKEAEKKGLADRFNDAISAIE